MLWRLGLGAFVAARQQRARWGMVLLLIVSFSAVGMPSVPHVQASDAAVSVKTGFAEIGVGYAHYNDKFFFAADDGTHGLELWVSDGSSAGTQLFADLASGSTGSEPTGFTLFQGWLFFTADDGVHGRELWRTDGTLAGTVMVKDIATGTDWGMPLTENTLFVANTRLLFAGDDGVHGRELWQSDGTFEGTVLLKDIKPGSGIESSSFPSGFTSFAGKTFFWANAALWQTDGTSAGTVEVAALNGQQLTVFNNTLFFLVIDGANETTLWKSDGTTAGTTQIKFLGRTTSYPVNPRPVLRALDTAIYVLFPEGDVTGMTIWESDGTEAGTTAITTAPKAFDSEGTLVLDNRIVFRDVNDFLWVTDGTAAGTEKLFEFTLTGQSAALTAILGKGLFQDNGDVWQTDGTVAGTTRIAQPEATGGIRGFTLVGRQIFFFGGTESESTLWRLPISLLGVDIQQVYLPRVAR